MVHQHAPLDPLLLPQSPADDQREWEAETAEQTSEEAILSESLRVLADGVAGTQEGDDADLEVAETTKDRELPVLAALFRYVHHCLADLQAKTETLLPV